MTTWSASSSPRSGRRRSRPSRSSRGPRRRASASASITLRRVARRREREQRRRRPTRRRSPGGRRSRRCRCRWRSRSGSRSPRSGRSPAAPAARRRAEVGDGVHRVGRRAAVAEREQLAARARSSRAAPPRPREQRSALSVSVCARSAPISSAFISTERADVVDDRLELALALVQERVQEARRAGVVDAARVAAREQAAVLEEHVHELPEHVVERLDQLLADVAGRRRRLELVLGAAPARTRSSGSRARARARAREPPRRRPRRRRTRSRCRPAARAARPARASSPPSPARPIAGSARLPTITGWTNSTATWRASERAAGERPNAIRRPPRAKRSAIRWQSRASRSACASKNSRLASVRRSSSASRRAAGSAASAARSRSDLLARGDRAPASLATRRSPRRCAR